MASKRLTQHQIDDIVERKLARETCRTIAAAVGCTPDTVTKHWHDWLDATSDERRDQLERKRSETIAHLDSIARLTFAQGVEQMNADEIDKAAKLLNVSRLAVSDLARVAGHNAPQEFKVAGGIALPTEEDARALLAKLPKSRQ